MTDRLAVEVVTSTPGEARLAMRGDVDIAADEVLAAAYADAAATGATRVVLDFAAVDYINSTGIAVEPSRVTSTVVSVIGLPPRGRMPPAWRRRW